MRAIYQRAGRQEGEGQEEKVTTPVSRRLVATNGRIYSTRSYIYMCVYVCGGEQPLSLSLSLSPSLHPKRERTPEETTPRRFSYYFWESLGPIVLAIPRDSVPFFLPSWSEDPRWTRGEKGGRRNRAEDGFGVIEMTRGSNAEFDETRRDEANRRTNVLSFRSILKTARDATLRFFFLFPFFHRTGNVPNIDAEGEEGRN